MKKFVLRNFENFTKKNLCQGLFFNKVAGLRPTTLSIKRLWRRCFPVNLAKFLRTPFLRTADRKKTPFLQDTSGRQLLGVNEFPWNFPSSWT